MRASFSGEQRRQVRVAERRAANLVRRFYVLAPREWDSLEYEVRTLSNLEPGEVIDTALAQVLCYGVRKTVECRVVSESDLYRICLQDHRILEYSGDDEGIPMHAMLLFLLTHELVHVVRFAQRMQRLDLAAADRVREEASVNRTARLILRTARERGLSSVFDRFGPSTCAGLAPLQADRNVPHNLVASGGGQT